jgi:hypothetical protein
VSSNVATFPSPCDGILLGYPTGGKRVAKTVDIRGNEISSYDSLYKYHFVERGFNGAEGLYDMLRNLSESRDCVMLNGAMTDYAKESSGPVRRISASHHDDAQPSIEDCARRLVAVDLDNAKPAGWDIRRPLVGAKAIMQDMGFADVSFVLQLTSTQRPDGSNCRMRIYFLLADPIYSSRRVYMLKRLKAMHPHLGLDSSTGLMSQPIYIGNPYIEDGEDFIDRRIIFCPGKRDYADMPELPDAPAAQVNNAYPESDWPDAGKELSIITSSDDRHGQIFRAAKVLAKRQLGIGGDVAGRMISNHIANVPEIGIRGQKRLADVADEGMRAYKHHHEAAKKIARARLITMADVTPVDDLLGRDDAVLALEGAIAAAMRAKHTGIKGGMGLGKTTKAVAYAVQHEKRTDIYVPDHAIAAEVVAMADSIGGAGTAMVIRGREQVDQIGNPLCEKTALINAFKGNHLPSPSASQICQRRDESGDVLQCEKFYSCKYVDQFMPKDEPLIVIRPHDYLRTEPSGLENELEEIIGKPELVLVDEGFLPSAVDEHTWPIDLARRSSSAADEIIDALLGLGAMPPLDAISFYYDSAVRELDHYQTVRPEQPLMAQIAYSKKLSPLPFIAHKILKEAYEAHGDLQQLGNVWVEDTPKQGRVVHYRKISNFARIRRGGQRTIFLDGTMITRAMQSLFPKIKIHNIPVKRNARFIQVYTHSFSITQMKQYKFMPDINGLAQLADAGVVCNRDMKLHFPGRPALHFNKLRGQNALKDCPVGIVMGRIQIPAYAAEGMARGIYTRQAIRSGEYLFEPQGYPGTDKGVKTAVHIDPDANDFMADKREGELLQGIDRFRLIHNVDKKTVFIFTNQPSVPFSELMTLEQVLGPRGAMQYLSAHDGRLPLSGSWLVEQGYSKNQNTAKQWAHSVRKWAGSCEWVTIEDDPDRRGSMLIWGGI